MIRQRDNLLLAVACTPLVFALCGLLWLLTHALGCEPYHGSYGLSWESTKPVEVVRE